MRAIVAALVLLLAGLMPLAAQTAPPADTGKPAILIEKRKLLVPPRNPDGTLKTTPFLADPVLWVREQQRSYYGSVQGALRAIKTDGAFAAALSLMVLSFGYGVFHAAGPGHGKVVIATWLAATESQLKRGVIVAALSAVVQALTAIAIVTAAVLLFDAAGTASRAAADAIESASYLLIVGLGLYLAWTAFGLRPRHAHHGHDHGPSCGHAHLPEVKRLDGRWSWAEAFSIAFAVGIRPCTGAIVALIFAWLAGIYWAGIASTFVMALGTAITVSAIAALTVYGKSLALRLAARDDGWLTRIVFALRLGGGLAIVCFGGLLFLGSLGTSTMGT